MLPFVCLCQIFRFRLKVIRDSVCRLKERPMFFLIKTCVYDLMDHTRQRSSVLSKYFHNRARLYEGAMRLIKASISRNNSHVNSRTSCKKTMPKAMKTVFKLPLNDWVKCEGTHHFGSRPRANKLLSTLLYYGPCQIFILQRLTTCGFYERIANKVQEHNICDALFSKWPPADSHLTYSWVIVAAKFAGSIF